MKEVAILAAASRVSRGPIRDPLSGAGRHPHPPCKQTAEACEATYVGMRKPQSCSWMWRCIGAPPLYLFSDSASAQPSLEPYTTTHQHLHRPPGRLPTSCSPLPKNALEHFGRQLCHSPRAFRTAQGCHSRPKLVGGFLSIMLFATSPML